MKREVHVDLFVQLLLHRSLPFNHIISIDQLIARKTNAGKMLRISLQMDARLSHRWISADREQHLLTDHQHRCTWRLYAQPPVRPCSHPWQLQCTSVVGRITGVLAHLCWVVSSQPLAQHQQKQGTNRCLQKGGSRMTCASYHWWFSGGESSQLLIPDHFHLGWAVPSTSWRRHQCLYFAWKFKKIWHVTEYLNFYRYTEESILTV